MNKEKEEQIRQEYIKEYGEINSQSEYVHIWISNRGNKMIRHMVEINDWVNDKLIRQVNLGKDLDYDRQTKT